MVAAGTIRAGRAAVELIADDQTGLGLGKAEARLREYASQVKQINRQIEAASASGDEALVSRLSTRMDRLNRASALTLQRQIQFEAEHAAAGGLGGPAGQVLAAGSMSGIGYGAGLRGFGRGVAGMGRLEHGLGAMTMLPGGAGQIGQVGMMATGAARAIQGMGAALAGLGAALTVALGLVAAAAAAFAYIAKMAHDAQEKIKAEQESAAELAKIWDKPKKTTEAGEKFEKTAELLRKDIARYQKEGDKEHEALASRQLAIVERKIKAEGKAYEQQEKQKKAEEELAEAKRKSAEAEARKAEQMQKTVQSFQDHIDQLKDALATVGMSAGDKELLKFQRIAEEHPERRDLPVLIERMKAAQAALDRAEAGKKVDEETAHVHGEILGLMGKEALAAQKIAEWTAAGVDPAKIEAFRAATAALEKAQAAASMKQWAEGQIETLKTETDKFNEYAARLNDAWKQGYLTYEQAKALGDRALAAIKQVTETSLTSFSPEIIARLSSGGGVHERTAKATEETARGVKELNRQMSDHGRGERGYDI
jgi:hypothetical protein